MTYKILICLYVLEAGKGSFFGERCWNKSNFLFVKSFTCLDTYCGLCYNKRKKGGVFVRKILDKLFENKKLAFWIPIAFAAVIYLLFVLFGTGEDKWELLIITPFVCAFWYFGVFLVVFMQVKNPMCPEGFLDFAELLFVFCFTAYSIIGTLGFIFGGCQSSIASVICAAAVSYSSISWAHSKR